MLDWCYVEINNYLGKRRVTPPADVRDVVISTDTTSERAIHWGFDVDARVAILSNNLELADDDIGDFVYMGCSAVDAENVVTIESAVKDANFRGSQHGDKMIFLSTEKLLEGSNRYVYMLHEEQFYEKLTGFDSD